MVDSVRDSSSRKKPANLSVDEALLLEARRLRLNLSAIFEDRLAEAVNEARRHAWLEDNRGGDRRLQPPGREAGQLRRPAPAILMRQFEVLGRLDADTAEWAP